MSILADEIRNLAHSYVRKGGKDHRRKQVRRLLLFVEWVQTQEKVGYLAQLGKRHVIRFWEAHQDFSDQTRYQYWLAFCELWRWLKKPGKPPRPFERTNTPMI